MKQTRFSQTLILIICLLIFHILFISFYKLHFNIHWKVIPYHLYVLLAIVGPFFLLLMILAPLYKNRQKAIKYLSVGLFICYFYCTVMIYFLNFISMTFWGDNITFAVLKSLFKNLPENLSALPFPAHYGYILLIIIPVAISVIFLSLSKVISQILRYAIFIKNSAGINYYYSRMIFPAGLVFTLMIFSLQIEPVRDSLAARREPISHLFLDLPRFFEYVKPDLGKLRFHEEARNVYPKNQRFDKKNVILIIVDSMRPQNMSLYGYQRNTTPFLDELNRNGFLQVASQGFSTCALSFCGILSILSSQIQTDFYVTNYKLHDLLKDQSYQVKFILSGNHDDWYKLTQYYHYYGSVDYYIDGSQSALYSENDDRLVVEELRQLQDFDGKPVFMYLHLMSCHMGGIRQDQYKVYQPEETQNVFSPDLEAMQNHYDNGLLQSDAILRQIFDILNDKSYLKNAIVVITSDHAEELGERGGFGHNRHLYQENISIPLIIYDSFEYPYPSIWHGTQIDIAPTIIDRLGLPIPETWSGSSLLKYSKNKTSFHIHGDYRAVVQSSKEGIYKYVYNLKSKTQQLFELNSDPDENMNLIEEVGSPKSNELKELLEDRLKSSMEIQDH